MFISTLLLIPWIVFGFKHPNNKFLGLRQTKKSLFSLLVIEIVFWTILFFLLAKPDTNIAGQGSFAWTYCYIYEKGIFPLMYIAESINGTLGDRIDRHYPILFLPTALIMDYLILKLISPSIFNFRRHSNEIKSF